MAFEGKVAPNISSISDVNISVHAFNYLNERLMGDISHFRDYGDISLWGESVQFKSLWFF